MDFTRKWTAFAIDAEYEHRGASAIVYAHNEAVRVRDEDIQRLRSALQSIVDLDDGDKPSLWEFQEQFRHAREALGWTPA